MGLAGDSSDCYGIWSAALWTSQLQNISENPLWCTELTCNHRGRYPRVPALQHRREKPSMTTEPDLLLTIAGLAIIAVTVGLLIWGKVSPVVAGFAESPRDT